MKHLRRIISVLGLEAVNSNLKVWGQTDVMQMLIFISVENPPYLDINCVFS